MKKMIRILALTMCMLMLFGGIASSAAVYSTYTYSITGKYMLSPDAYAPYKVLTEADMNLPKDFAPFNKPTDLFIDDQGYLYIADPLNGRIVILDQYYKYVRTITTFYNTMGVYDRLNAPAGVFVTPSDNEGNRQVYIADTENRRIVVFNYDGTNLVYSHLVKIGATQFFKIA